MEDSHVPPAKTFGYSLLTVQSIVGKTVEHLVKGLKKRFMILELGDILTKSIKIVYKPRVSCQSR